MLVYGHLRRKSQEFQSQSLRRYFILRNIPIWAVSRWFSTKSTSPTRGIFILKRPVRLGRAIYPRFIFNTSSTYLMTFKPQGDKWSALRARFILFFSSELSSGLGEIHERRHLQVETEISSEDGLSGSHKVKVRFLLQVFTFWSCTNFPHFRFSLRFGGCKRTGMSWSAVKYQIQERSPQILWNLYSPSICNTPLSVAQYQTRVASDSGVGTNIH